MLLHVLLTLSRTGVNARWRPVRHPTIAALANSHQKEKLNRHGHGRLHRSSIASSEDLWIPGSTYKLPQRTVPPHTGSTRARFSAWSRLNLNPSVQRSLESKCNSFPFDSQVMQPAQTLFEQHTVNVLYKF